MDYADGRLLYLVLLLAVLVFFLLRGHRPRLSQGIRALAIWGVILLALATAYAILAG